MKIAKSRADLLRTIANQEQDWDIIVIGGGITGAGILLEAARRGLRVLLVEQKDFAWGTSSRSSKLVHGGLRYIKEGKFFLTRDSVRERQGLMQAAAGLVEPQSFAFADYQGRKPGRWMFALGLVIYDFLAGLRGKHYFSAQDFQMLAPHIPAADLKGGSCYLDAKTDDARLVLRVLQEARAAGAIALNYLAVKSVMYDNGHATGVVLQDALSMQEYQINAKVTINATGAWADDLRQQQGASARLRPLRGSHLLIPAWRLPVAQAVSLMHPRDGRPVFVYPWEGVSLVGTTDVDHSDDVQQETAITAHEVAYLMEAMDFQFPQLQLKLDDIIASYAGIRPVIDTGKADPSKEGRDHAIWLEKGLLTVTGGKLTTFRLIAQDALKHIAHLFPGHQSDQKVSNLFARPSDLANEKQLNHTQKSRLQGHYGQSAAEIVQIAQDGELDFIPGTLTMWVELRWAARHEAVEHLQDLMLRRTRLGLLVRQGGLALLPRIRAICQPELKWNDERWENEQSAYLQLWNKYYALPDKSSIPEWRNLRQSI
ncbi:FAD-dependent glycerol-3-phosphate dehydrogenase [Undibacterium sp. KW1]|uniref:glycerol-3-phosphate dehydrogenase/oxidase n=1 Tax=Undibacterium sp. KW1 TaxID=2058624 RepID=UPI001331C46E|nr:glycerol-3-phosphate dehydrogenase/oxidase [Undibacterium sp. KW1]BBB60577.1 FAD-dependent glycerol-3-phosphate dehydrogenase [Undibacterium sp. KW1]